MGSPAVSLQDVARALRERWITVAASVLVVLALGVLVWAVRPPTYTATVTVYAAPRAVDALTTPDAAYQGSLLAKERVPSYAQLVSSPQVLAQVIARARLATDPDELTNRVTATTTVDSVLVDVAVDAGSVEEAVRTANAFADALPVAVDQIELNGAPGVPPVSLRVIRPIPVPTSPSTPGLGLTLAVALLAGIIVGLAVALVRDALDRSVRGSDDLADAGAPTPVLASVPAAPRRRAGSSLADPRSAEAEAYRRLRTALAPGRHAVPGVLAVTSPGAGEGRTTVACNLAVVAAAAGLAVLVVDADLRRPRVATTLGVAPGDGLTDVLAGTVRSEEAIRGCKGGFEVLPTGSLPSNPSELLAGEALEELFDALHARYDLVLVDTPPVLPVTDAAVVAAAADGVVVLARYGRTSGVAVASAVATLTAADAHLVGTVLTLAPRRGPALLVAPDVRSPITPRPRRPERLGPIASSGRGEGSGRFERPAASTISGAPRLAAPDARPDDGRPDETHTARVPLAPQAPAAVRPAGPPRTAMVPPSPSGGRSRSGGMLPEPRVPDGSGPRAQMPRTADPAVGGRARGTGVGGHSPNGHSTNGTAVNGPTSSSARNATPTPPPAGTSLHHQREDARSSRPTGTASAFTYGSSGASSPDPDRETGPAPNGSRHGRPDPDPPSRRGR